jgi:hypothetical protein
VFSDQYNNLITNPARQKLNSHGSLISRGYRCLLTLAAAIQEHVERTGQPGK